MHIHGWNFDNSYTRLPNTFYAFQKPASVPLPQLVLLNEPLAEELGLDAKGLQGEAGARAFSGNQVPKGALPIAQAYAGHQFGHFTMLGDGRAILLGEQMNPQGQRYDIQLKGAGRTPYSRRGDGKAVLKPMLREYLISEGMYALGIPTTRSLAITLTGETVRRENWEKGAILTRVASSHIRVGTFEYVAQWRTLEELTLLADYTLKRHFSGTAELENPYLFLLEQVIRRQAILIAKWQLVGFIHGVMNTDNMAISGETIDYGPCAFMDTYDPETVFSSIDVHGRYAYGNQPYIAGWNLARFAETLLPLLHKEEGEAIKLAQKAITSFTPLYQQFWIAGMRKKLGLCNEEAQDVLLVEDLLTLMQQHKADYTNTFRALTLGDGGAMPMFEATDFICWRKRWQERLERQPLSQQEVSAQMSENNPAIIPRNHRVEEALSAAEQGDYGILQQLLQVIAQPFAYSKEQEVYTLPPEEQTIPYRTFCGT